MRLISNTLFKAVRNALYAGAAVAAGLGASPVLAQSESEETTEKLETVVVTGSRIRRADAETAQPVFVIDRAQIEHQGLQSVADILLSMSVAGSPPISRSQVLASGESVGGSYVDLRDLGPQRTLVLVNGKRLGITNGGLQDLNTIPTSVVERIEVLKDGASSIYGSDAIAGVINVITRTRFDGAEANFYVGQYDQDDGQKQSYDFTLGAHGERGALTMSAQYAKEDPVWARNRYFSSQPFGEGHPGLGWSGTTAYGAITNRPGGGSWSAIPGTDTTDIANYRRLTRDLYANSNQQMMLNTGLERKSIYIDGTYRITDEITFRSDALYNKRDASQQVAGYPLSSGTANQGKSLGPMSIDSWYNPLGNWHNEKAPQSANFSRRGWEQPRVTDSGLSTYRFTGGFDGAFDVFGRSWFWDVGTMLNRNEVLKTNTGNFNLINTARAIGPSFRNSQGQIQCGTPDNPIPLGYGIGQCTPWNVFSPYGDGGVGSLSDPNVQRYVYQMTKHTGQTKTVDYAANLNGSPFSLPAGNLGVAVGLEYRRESGSYLPDALSQIGATTDLGAGPTGGSYRVKEAYLEVDVPILKDMPFARDLAIDAAVRRSDYDSFGNTTNSKLGLKWKPIDDLLVRGTYAEGFRAPTISDLYGGTSQTFSFYADPCDTKFGVARGTPACGGRVAGVPGVPGYDQPPGQGGYRQIGQAGVTCQTANCQTGYAFSSGSNPFLQPEFAKTRTAGFVYSPSFVEGFDVSLDWYKVRIDNQVSSDSPGLILEDCYLREQAARCRNFVRDPATGTITGMQFGNTNLGWVETAGYDLGIRYRLPEFSFGRFMLTWESTYIDYFNVNTNPNDPTSLVSPNTGWGSSFRMKSNLGVDWSLGNFGATWGVRYFSGTKEACAFDQEGGPECSTPNYQAPHLGHEPYPVNKHGANTFHDVQVRYKLPWKATVSVGANNLFDHYGQMMYANPNSQYAYYGGFDIGRFAYVRYQQRF
ncbi:TonB-dependent receptor plug domain-containing protein [Dokdonella soli]|uniref:TonB-dependent receptor n=1 Tax=Dokdonella soli TaxID=529810 RepID=A0ABP3U1Q5_9GAMM